MAPSKIRLSDLQIYIIDYESGPAIDSAGIFSCTSPADLWILGNNTQKKSQERSMECVTACMCFPFPVIPDSPREMQPPRILTQAMDINDKQTTPVKNSDTFNFQGFCVFYYTLHAALGVSCQQCYMTEHLLKSLPAFDSSIERNLLAFKETLCMSSVSRCEGVFAPCQLQWRKDSSVQ